MFKINIIPYTLKFKNPAGTSRGVYKEHKVWYLLFINTENTTHYGIGECAPLQGLSCDYNEGYEKQRKNNADFSNSRKHSVAFRSL